MEQAEGPGDTPNRILRRRVGLPVEPLSPRIKAVTAVLAALRGAQADATSVEIANAAGVGYSTACAALTELEGEGLALRIPGGRKGRHGRVRDRWRAIHPTTTDESQAGPDSDED